MDVNLVESIYGKVKKKKRYEKKTCFRIVFRVYLFFLYISKISNIGNYDKIFWLLQFSPCASIDEYRPFTLHVYLHLTWCYLVYRACVNHAVKFAQQKICCKFIFVQIEKRISILENKAVHRLICFNKTIIIHFIQSKRKSC